MAFSNDDDILDQWLEQEETNGCRSPGSCMEHVWAAFCVELFMIYLMFWDK
jgi:hypothetical protein